MIDRTSLWIIIIGLGIGSYTLRFLFTGLVGSRTMPEGVLRHLRYTAVAIIPAMVAPQVLWPAANDGVADAPRLAAAAVTLAVGMLTRQVFTAIICGAGTLYGLLYLAG